MPDSSPFASLLGVGSSAKELTTVKPQPSKPGGQQSPENSFKSSMEQAQKAKPAKPERATGQQQDEVAAQSPRQHPPSAQKAPAPTEEKPEGVAELELPIEPSVNILPVQPQPEILATNTDQPSMTLLAGQAITSDAADADIGPITAGLELSARAQDALAGLVVESPESLERTGLAGADAITGFASLVAARPVAGRAPQDGSALPVRQGLAAGAGLTDFSLDAASISDRQLTSATLEMPAQRGTTVTSSAALLADGQTFDAGALALDGLESAEGLTLDEFAADLLSLEEPLANERGMTAILPGRGNLLTEGFAPGSRINVPVNTPFGSPDWQGAVAERAVLLVRQNIQTAELQLDPPELGPLQVRIQIQNDHAVVNFSSANVQVRDALDQTMARLKDMLQEQGFSQVETGVSDHSDRRSRQQGAEPERVGSSAPMVGEEAPVAQALQIPLRSGIDYFA